MYTDLFGKKRVKLALHQHTTRSDGRATPEEVARLYREAGYDAVALTDHWVENGAEVIEGMPILASCEYNTIESGCLERLHDSAERIYHIVGVCYDRLPGLQKASAPPARVIVDEIHAAGGIAILAHPAWSLNTADQIAALRDVDAVEIYNTTSACGNNRRPDSSVLIDEVASHHGVLLPISGADDSHRYTTPLGRHIDYCTTFVMAECDSVDPEEIKKAIRERRFYTSQGPEIHLSKKGKRFIVDSSPVSEIIFFTNLVCDAALTLEGDGLTHFEYESEKTSLRFVRAMVIDAEGRMAWSQFLEA